MIQQGSLEVQGDRWIPSNQTREVVRLEKAEPLGRVCDRFLQVVRHNGQGDQSGAIATELITILTGLSQSIQQGGLPVQL